MCTMMMKLKIQRIQQSTFETFEMTDIIGMWTSLIGTVMISLLSANIKQSVQISVVKGDSTLL
jgi:uncharacterized paraquat-inducible protein A